MTLGLSRGLIYELSYSYFIAIEGREITIELA